MAPERPPMLECSTQAKPTLWVVDEWRCELWVVDGTPSVRLFNHERLVREIRVLPYPHHDAMALADRWKTLLTERHRSAARNTSRSEPGATRTWPRAAENESTRLTF
jgi:hypothetical protein